MSCIRGGRGKTTWINEKYFDKKPPLYVLCFLLSLILLSRCWGFINISIHLHLENSHLLFVYLTINHRVTELESSVSAACLHIRDAHSLAQWQGILKCGILPGLSNYHLV